MLLLLSSLQTLTAMSISSSIDIFFLASFILFVFLSYLKFQKKFPADPINYPLLGMFPAVLANVRDLHGWMAHGLPLQGGTFEFRGPWLLGMDLIMTADPANVNHVFNSNASNYPKGKDFADIFDIFGKGIFNADADSWRAQRKKMHGLINAAKFRVFVKKCAEDKVKNGLVPLLERLAEGEAVVDFQEVMMRLTFDMTCILVFGVDPASLNVDFRDVPAARAMDDVMEAMFVRHAVPPACWKAMRRLCLWKEKQLAEARDTIIEFVARNIEKANEDSLLSSYEGDYEYMRDTAVNLMFAGRDTTGAALSWFFWLVSKNPRVGEEIVREIAKVGASDSVYVHAALCEALRLYPPVPFEHKAPLVDDMLPSGVRAPRGRKILFATYAMGRMEAIWGKDFKEYMPERWISETASKGEMRMKHEPSYKFMAFNCGPRTCLGKEVAFTQMKAVVAAVMGKFEFLEVEGHVVEPKLSAILQMKNGWKVKIKRKKIILQLARVASS